MKKILTSFFLILIMVFSSAPVRGASIEPIGPWIEPLGIEMITHSYDIDWGQAAPKPRFSAYGKELVEHVDFEYCYEFVPTDDSWTYVTENYMDFKKSGVYKTIADIKDHELAGRLQEDYACYEYALGLIPLDTFQIRPVSMTKLSYGPLPNLTYGDHLYLDPYLNLSYNGIKLENRYFNINYSHNYTLDETITITPYGSDSAFTGALTIPIKLAPRLITQENTVFQKTGEPYPFTPGGCRPGNAVGFVIVVDGHFLAAEDFDSVFENNENVGTATVTITGKGRYLGSATTTFQIGPRDISECEIEVDPVPYTGKPVGKPKTTVNCLYTKMVEGRDYEVQIGECIEQGEYPVTITGKGNLKGSVTKTFKIEGIHISACDHTVPRFEYDPAHSINGIKPTVTFKGKTLAMFTDYETYYTLDRKGTGPVGKNSYFIRGLGDYCGEVETYYEVYRDISKLKCVIDDAAYTGKEVKPSIVLTDGTDKIKVDSKNFKVTFKNNTKVGTASVTIEGKGYYYGKVSGTFNIVKATPTPTPASKPNSNKVITRSGDPRSGIMDFVKRIYQFVLDREPEEDGAAFWSDELWSFRRTGAEVAQGFIFSPEFEARGTTDEQFVTILYKTFFGRDPEEDGLNYWLSQLSSGTMDRVTVANGFIYSQEWADTCASYGIRSGGDIKPTGVIAPTEQTYAFVERMYTTAMGRGYDEEGKQYWASELANFNVTGEVCGASFFLSEEMNSYALSDKDFLGRLYATFMNREPDADGEGYWLGIMASGTPRADIVLGFTRSPEFTDKCVEARILPY